MSKPPFFKRLFTFRMLTVCLILVSQVIFAQKKDENIGTEVVNVVKPYTPSISDAFKVKETPSLNDDENTVKEEIKYVIFSFPVASTFVPSKGRAVAVEKAVSEKSFTNYSTLGFGNYGTVIGELFLTKNINPTDYVAAMFRHHSSQGGIKEVILDDKFASTSLDMSYGSLKQDFNWILDFGYKNQIYNWYGLQTPIDTDLASVLNPQQTYHSLDIGGKIETNDAIINEVALKYNRFWDSYGSAENRFFIKPAFDLAINSNKIDTHFIVDYLSGSFDAAVPSSKIKYGYTNIGLNPSFSMQKNDWSLQFGLAAFYSMDSEGDSNQFKIYPRVNASLKIVGDYMIFYSGVEGNLEQNSYRDFISENPFLSPNLFITPTDKQFDIFAGVKGKLDSSVSYNLRGSYCNEKNKALFKSNNFSEIGAIENFEHGNSLGVVYDNVKTIQFFGELKADWSKTISFGINGTFSGYVTEYSSEAWNLPEVKMSANLDVSLTEKWYAGFNLFFMGERKDLQINTDALTLIAPSPSSIPSYIDANLNIGYKHSNRITGFLKFNNIANQDYQKWMNYTVQGFQVVLGGNYKFDF